MPPFLPNGMYVCTYNDTDFVSQSPKNSEQSLVSWSKLINWKFIFEALKLSFSANGNDSRKIWSHEHHLLMLMLLILLSLYNWREIRLAVITYRISFIPSQNLNQRNIFMQLSTISALLETYFSSINALHSFLFVSLFPSIDPSIFCSFTSLFKSNIPNLFRKWNIGDSYY